MMGRKWETAPTFSIILNFAPDGRRGLSLVSPEKKK